jgi:hypothetical protein
MMKHRNMRLLGVLVAGVLGAAAIGGLMLTSDHWWKKWAQARVLYNGRPSNTANVYRSSEGKILLVLKEPGEDSFYIVYPERRIVGMPNRSNFRFLAGYAFSRAAPPLIANMKGAKGETDPELLIQNGLIQFKSFNHAQIQITW